MGFRWKETSSKTGSNVSDLFLEVAKMILIEKRSQLSIRSDMSIRHKPNHLAPGVEIPTDDGRPIKSHSTRPTEAIRMMSIRRRAKSVRAPPASSKTKNATLPRNTLNDSKLESEKKTPKSCCSISWEIILNCLKIKQSHWRLLGESWMMNKKVKTIECLF